MSVRRTAGFVVAAVAAATTWLIATWLIAPTAPADAATCSTASGVSVVVDHHELGGGVQSVCDSGGAGKYADRQFTESGFALTYVQRQPGFVCRVDGAPSNDPCVNTPPSDAYWGLWWSDGKSGKWTYSSTGVSSLKVPAGGYVALSWNGSSSSDPPGVAPKAHATASPSPSPSSSAPTTSPTRQPSPQPTHTAQPVPPAPPPASATPGTPTRTPTPTPTPPPATVSSSPTRTASRTPSAKPSRSGTKHHRHRHPSSAASPSQGVTATTGPQPARTVADPPATTGSGLPGWVAPVVAGLLLAAAGLAAVVRRRTGRP